MTVKRRMFRVKVDALKENLLLSDIRVEYSTSICDFYILMNNLRIGHQKLYYYITYKQNHANETF